MIQVVKQGAECWVVTRVDEIWKNAHEYETIGRVRRDGAMYCVDLPDWKEETLAWKKHPRTYLIPRAAFKFIIDESKRSVVLS